MDWGVPDWEDQSAYPKSGDALTMREWWWQFTRRNLEYRQLWQDRQPLLREFAEKNADWCREIAERDGCSLESAVENRWSRRLSRADRLNLQQRFRLNGYLNPTLDRSDGSLRHFQYIEGAPANIAYFDVRALENDQADGIFEMLRFDLSRPIPEQLKAAGEYLIDMQRHVIGKAVKWHPDPDKWPLFLRALDARGAHKKPTYAKMAATFWPKEDLSAQKARDSFDAAQKLRNYFQY